MPILLSYYCVSVPQEPAIISFISNLVTAFSNSNSYQLPGSEPKYLITLSIIIPTLQMKSPSFKRVRKLAQDQSYLACKNLCKPHHKTFCTHQPESELFHSNPEQFISLKLSTPHGRNCVFHCIISMV